MKTCLHKGLYLHAHGSFTHNNPKLEIAKLSINCWAGKQTVIYSYNGSEPSNPKEQIAENATAEKTLKEARRNRLPTVWFHLYKILEKANH